MQTFLQRSIWIAIWASTMAIDFWLVSDLSRDQPILFFTILLAAIVQSVALVYARIHWRDSNKTSAGAALWVGILCLGVSVVSAVSYWSSTIESVHSQVQRDKNMQAGVDLVKERRQHQLAQTTLGKMPSQIEAEIATAAGTREVIALRAQLKAAKELQELQGQILADSTQTVNFSIRRSFYEFAAIGSENLGGSVRMWIFATVILIVVCMISLHVLSLYIGFAPPRRPEHEPNAKAREAMADYHAAIKARQEAQETEQFLRGISLAPPPSSPLLSHTEAFRMPSPPLPLAQALKDEPEATAPEVHDVVGVLAQQPNPFVGSRTGFPYDSIEEPSDVFDYKTKLQLTPKEIRRLAREQSLKKNEVAESGELGNVEVWASLLLRPGKPNQSVTSGECRDNFREYCEMHGLAMIENKKMLSRQIGAIIDRMSEGESAKGKRRSRNAAGAVYHGFYLLSPEDLAKLSPERARA